MSSFACWSFPCFLLLLYFFTSSNINAATFEVLNECAYTVWAAAVPGGGRRLEPGQSWIINASPGTTQGRIWGRTNCSFDGAGLGSCETGDCNGLLQCQGYGQPPNTVAEYYLNQFNKSDFFDISLVDGFNVPMDFSPVSGNCSGITCVADINGQCPIELRTKGGCNNACTVFKTGEYCCDSGNCGPTNYSRFFKQRCPDAYSYPKDDQISTFTCPDGTDGTDYRVIFCSTGNSTNTTSPGEITPSPPPEIMPNTTTSSGEITPSPPPEIRPNTTSRRNWVPIIAGIVGGVLVIISFVVIIVWRVRWSKSNDADEDEEDDHIKHVPGMPVRFSYEDLRVATHDFKEILGRGGFGSVFKGVLEDGTGIAVKRLDKIGQGSKRAFLAEVETIGSLHHFNLVRLIGFCAEKSYRLLVYEYLSNGSLDKWIFKKIQGSSLDWHTREKIMLDIAKGLAYLHEECRQTIMHLDIKPQNILLDPNFNAKISDFGLSKLIDREMSKVQLSMRGTPGYLAPEWHKTLGHITVKVDVYSFGIVLLEVVCARRTVDHSQPESAFHLLRMLQNKPECILERLDEYLQSDREEIIRTIKVAAWCLQDDPERRPLMSTVVKVLEGVMEIDSNLVYKFSHALAPPPVVDDHISSAPQQASNLSHPR